MSKKTNKGRWLDRHHLLWQARHWNRGYTKVLREHWYCSVYIPKATLHAYIHKELCDVPAPSGVSVKIAIEHLEYLKRYEAISESDDIEKRLVVLIALFDCIEPETTEALKKQLRLVHAYKSIPPIR